MRALLLPALLPSPFPSDSPLLAQGLPVPIPPCCPKATSDPHCRTYTCWKHLMLSRMLNCCQRLEKFTLLSM